MNKSFFVVDTNTFISAQLIEKSVSAQAFDKVILKGTIALSESVLNEYIEVLYRKKLDKYLNESKRKSVLKMLERNAVFFQPNVTVTDCRDSKDNCFLELALACNAQCIISGDPDLLILNPFRSIPIISGVEFLGVKG